jgi:starch synthase
MASKKNIPEKLKILMVATEAAPYVSVGGAGSVIAHLSKSLIKIGHDVRVFIPKFGSIDEEKYPMSMVYEGLKVPTGEEDGSELICNVKSLTSDGGVIFYFLENQEYYEKRANVYGYKDDPVRFLLLSRGAIEFVKTKIFVPNIIHCNDWHTGSLPNFLSTSYKSDPLLESIHTVFTIHNLAYQGTFDHKHISELDYDDGSSDIASFFSPRTETQNFMKRGILHADAVNTVSQSYAREVLTPDFGEGLDKILLALKSKFFGIVNGIDYEEFNPATDTMIEMNYDVNSLNRRKANKKALQKEFGLNVDEDTLLLGFVGRLDYMKGVDMAVEVLKNTMREYDIQFVQVGGGDWKIVEMLEELKAEFPKKVGIHPYPNFTMPRFLFSGCDCILYPSRFEPCGIVQLEAMRYGAVPIVRNVGGLSDTVENFDSLKAKGNGFVFNEFSEYSLYGQIVRAYELFKNKSLWKKLQINGMKSDFSWEHSAAEYVKLYERAITLRTQAKERDKTMETLVG